ncbi:hypothetical protein [Botrimarina sp.]|uniref:hypothetical protein n=1 Tax=Botrimarina sp. TaxID=2795802 RepID=UPI0032EDDCB2
MFGRDLSGVARQVTLYSSFTALLWGAAVGSAQAPPAAPAERQAPGERPAGAKRAEADPTDPQDVELRTADGVLLAGTYYPASEAGRDTPVVVALADENESPIVFDRLAFRFQMPGPSEEREPIAVFAVALRGQGDSTRVRRPDGTVVDRRGAKLTPADAAAMVKTDMEAVRRFLVEKNDAGELNLNRLGYLGVGFGALVAANAAAVDWAMPDLDRGKQGRDVKALALVSPPWKSLGLEMLQAIRQPGVQTQVAVLLTYGRDDDQAQQAASRIVVQLERGRMRLSDEETPTAPVIDRPGKSKLQGTAWLKQAGSAGEDLLLEFFANQLAKPELPWVQRRLD